MVHDQEPGPEPGPGFDSVDDADLDDDPYLFYDNEDADFSVEEERLNEEELALLQAVREEASREWLIPEEWLDDDTRDQPDG